MQKDSQFNNTAGADRLKWVEKVSSIMDSKYTIPGTDFRFGLDPILGLIPGIGDLISFLISIGLVLTMANYGASGKVIAKMLLNSVLDFLIGNIPVLGWIFDFAYKANRRNLRLLKEHYEEGKHQGSATGIVAAIIIAGLAVTGLTLYGVISLIEWLVNLLNQA